MTKTGICNWPKNRLYWGRGFKRPAALLSKKIDPSTPSPGGGGGGGFSLVNQVM